MGTFDRYLCERLLVHFGFFALVLVAVYWVNRAVGLFDRLIEDGSNVATFLQFTALALPNVIHAVLPISALVATLYCVNRLMGDAEMVVAQTSGLGPWRLVRPMLAFGLVVGVMVAILGHLVVPASRTALAERGRALSEDVTARFLKAGEFLNPTDGITVYVRDITPEGELLGLFLQDRRDGTVRTSYTAERAYLVRAGGDGARLVMLDGMAQTLEVATRNLFVTTFDDFAYDLNRLAGPSGARRPDPRELPTPVLLAAPEAAVLLTGADRAELRYEGHVRIADSLLAFALPAMAFGFLMQGGYSRLGLWRQHLAAVVAAVMIQLVANWAETEASDDAAMLWATYLPVVIAALLAAGLLGRDAVGPRPWAARRGSA